MPRRRKDNGRTSTVSIYGFHAPRGGTIYGYYKRYEKSLGLEEKRTNWPEARRRLDAWITSIENPGAAQAARHARPSLFEAAEQYTRMVMEKRPQGAQEEFRDSLRTFYTREMKDLPLDFGTIQEHLTDRMQALTSGEIVSKKTKQPFAPRTILQRVMRQQEFFRWCHGRRVRSATGEDGPRWLRDPDPFQGIALPSEPVESENRIYSDEEHGRIMSRFLAWARLCRRRRPRAKLLTTDWYPLLWRWQRLTAMRIEETTSLRWADAVPEAERGKRNHVGSREIAINKAKNRKRRFIPLAAIPGLPELVAELRAMPRLPGGKVFPWAVPCAPQQAFREFLQYQKGTPKIERGETTIHVYRATAKALWAEWGIAEHWRDYYAGHDRGTARKHYDTRPSYEEMMRDGAAAMQREPGNGAPAGYLPDIGGARRVIQGDFRRRG